MQYLVDCEEEDDEDDDADSVFTQDDEAVDGIQDEEQDTIESQSQNVGFSQPTIRKITHLRPKATYS